MNRGTRGHIPKTTNPAGVKGHGGRSLALGRPTFFDEIIAREDSSSGSIFRPSNSPRRHTPQSSGPPHFETSFSSGAKAENFSPASQNTTLEDINNIEDQSSVA